MERIGDILKEILDPSMVRQAVRFHEFFHGWSRVVGRKLAAVSRVHEVEGETVVVSVDHPAALTSIMLIERRIVGALRKRFPALAIKRVRAIVQPPGVRKDEPSSGLQKPSCPDSEASRALARVRDSELKAVLSSFYAAISESSEAVKPTRGESS